MAKVSYDRDLAVVTRIEAKGARNSSQPPELVEVAELNDEDLNSHTWLKRRSVRLPLATSPGFHG
jgi:hypothetical protein